MSSTIPKPLPRVFFKTGVIVNGAHMYEEIALIIQVARNTAPPTVDNAVWVTSANDSRHMTNSKHYSNEAFDIRIRNLVGGHAAARTWVANMQHELGDDYDCVLESDHAHIEFDPK